MVKFCDNPACNHHTKLVTFKNVRYVMVGSREIMIQRFRFLTRKRVELWFCSVCTQAIRLAADMETL